ncbi:MAG: hypothetical protein D6809_07005 [Gammaproteobacteria bacterium]|nr:MAG: hypothetical protein D6809_07005 [Gammaproteobacteria bacterium]
MGRPGGADPFAPPWAAGPSGTLAGLYLGSAPVAGWRLRTVGAPWRPAGPAAAETRSGGLLEGLRLRWRQGWQLLREVGGTPLRLRLDRAGPQMEAGADEGLKLDLRFGPGRSALVEPRLFLGLHHRW